MKTGILTPYLDYVVVYSLATGEALNGLNSLSLLDLHFRRSHAEDQEIKQ